MGGKGISESKGLKLEVTWKQPEEGERERDGEDHRSSKWNKEGEKG